MKFNTEAAPPEALEPRQVQVGDVYPCKGGRGYLKKAWVVVAIRETRCVVLSINELGEIVAGETYGTSAFERRDLIGTVEGMDEMTFNVDWIKP